MPIILLIESMLLIFWSLSYDSYLDILFFLPSSKDGSTALMFACEKGYEDIVKKLLSNPACNVSLKDNVSMDSVRSLSSNLCEFCYEYSNCLWFYIYMFLMFINLHFSLTSFLPSQDSQTAYDIALSYSHNEICTLLKKHRKFKKRWNIVYFFLNIATIVLFLYEMYAAIMFSVQTCKHSQTPIFNHWQKCFIFLLFF